MTLPVSSYEELLARVRSLTSETIQLRREITSSLSDHSVLESGSLSTDNDYDHNVKTHSGFLPEGLLVSGDLKMGSTSDVDASKETTFRSKLFLNKKEDEVDEEFKEIDEKLSSPARSPVEQNYFQRNGWASDTCQLWRSGPSSLNLDQTCKNFEKDLTSSVNYSSREPQSLNTFLSSSKRIYSHQQLGVKVEMVYSLLSMLDMNNREDMSKTFLAMSSSAESCHAMRQSGCLPLLIQLIHSNELNKEVRDRAAEALHNVVHSQTDERRRKREVRVLKLLQQVREYCDDVKNNSTQEILQSQEPDKHPINAIGTLMKFSFDAEHRQAICILGGLHAISELIQVDHEAHGSTTEGSCCITLRRYAGMSLTNLTFGDCKNKALLCSFNKFMAALVDQLQSPCEDLRQVTASVLRNLSWRADSESKQALRDVSAVPCLTVSAMEAKKESTLKSILSALWNLSAHCSLNKIDICSVPGALAFLVKMLKYKSSSNTLAIVENAGGILRNISSHIAVREDYRQILRENNCFEVLLEQLKSPSLTIVSNACGTLWNLSARCPKDQRKLWEMGATSMLRSLVQSKHKMISMGSSAALKNLLAANPNGNLLTHLDSTAKSLGLQNLPTLFVRKKRALEQELNISLAETCENIDTIDSPILSHLPQGDTETKKGNGPTRSESRDSVHSTHSDSAYERINQINHKNDEKLLENKNLTLHDSLDKNSASRKIEDQKLMRRYKASMIPTPTFKKANQDGIDEKDKEEPTFEENMYDGVIKTDSKEVGNLALKEKKKKRIPVLSSKQPRNMTPQGFEVSHDHCSLQSGDQAAFEKKKLESEENEGFCIEKENYIANTGVSSLHDGFISSASNSEENRRKESNSYIEMHEDVDNGNENKRIGKDGEGHKSKRSLREETAHDREVLEFPGQDSQSKCSASKNRHQEMLPTFGPQLLSCAMSSEVPKELEFSKLKKITEETKNNSTCLHMKRQEEPREISPYNSLEENLRQVQENTSLDGEVSQNLLSEPDGTSQQCCASPNLENSHDNNQKMTHCTTFSSRTEEGRSISNYCSVNELQRGTKVGGVVNAELIEKTSAIVPFEDDSKSAFNSKDESKSANVLNVDSTNLKTLTNGILPKFKVGSPITDSKVLQMEANKICREIRKHQDFEMGCSLISEVSSSSFLDTGDYSLFECSTDVVDFNDLENSDYGRVSSKIKGLPSRKFTASQANESVSLPSLESLKNEQIEALDLDSSILSVASITSEIAETYSKDFDGYNTYTKTYKMGTNDDFLEDADATLVYNDDDTLNADSLQKNFENLDEDNSLHSQENLPLDIENFEEEKTPRMKKKLTPKEKRKTFHERYRTYTIRDLNGTNSLEPSPNSQGLDKIHCVEGNVPLNEVEGAEVNEKKLEAGLFSKTFYGSSHEISFRPKKFDEQGYAIDSKSLNDLLSIEPVKRKELVDNAKLVAFSLKTAVRDCEVMSDSELEEPHTDIDTATYSKNRRSYGYSSHGLHHIQNYEEPVDGEANDDTGKKTARILKPNENSNGKTEESPKGIRGRRRALYSSPLKNSLRTDFSISNSPKTPAVQATVDAKKSGSDPCAPAVLHREGTFTKEDGLAFKKSEIKNARGIPVLSKNSVPARYKSGSVLGNVRNTGENPVLKSGKNVKTNERRSDADSSQRRTFPVETTTRTGGSGGIISKRPASTGLTASKMRNSSSSQNVRATNSAGSGRSKNITLQSVKSHSDASLNLVASKDTVGKQKTPKKEVTSKIASLWRKVEETKLQNRNTKDNRVWISGNKNLRSGDDVLVVEREEILDIPSRKIVHSLTCQTLSNEASTDCDSPIKNSKKFQELSRTRGVDDGKDRIERRNVISAVVSPYNYNPPVSERTTTSKIAEVNAVHRGSMKITTV